MIAEPTDTSSTRSPYIAGGEAKTCLQSSIFDGAVAFSTDRDMGARAPRSMEEREVNAHGASPPFCPCVSTLS
jgi:hypothetical protein